MSTTPTNDPTAPHHAYPTTRSVSGATGKATWPAHLDPERKRIAAESLHQPVGDLADKSFIDIGCGSGLFSLCAHRAGRTTS